MTYLEQRDYSWLTYLSDHFKEGEFLCTCRGEFCNGVYEDGIDKKLIVLLEMIRTLVGDKPMTIISGYRCRKRNLLPKPQGVGGASSSQHMLATAADFTVSGMKPWRVRMKIRKAFRKLRRNHAGFKGLGFGLGKYSTFTHVDCRRNKARWTG